MVDPVPGASPGGARSTVPDAGSLLAKIVAGAPADDDTLTHVTTMPARSASSVPWPSWVAPTVTAAFTESGVAQPWAHQADTASLAWAGKHVVVATGTASGKSLGYQLPVLSTLVNERRATALYLSPTKALGVDQLRSVSALGLDEGEAGVRPAVYDGDTPIDERDWARTHARWIFTNPDMLHRSILPRHAQWGAFLRRLRYVVLDECHTYRGVFGSHVALLLRRLRRLCARYGCSPTFVLASATVADPAESASRLTGLPMAAVTEDSSPRGPRTVALWEPPLLEELRGENGAPVRRSAGAEASRMLADLVVEGARTLAFVRSRAGAEVVALRAARSLAEVDPELAKRVSAYRAGFLPEERRALERALESGELLGVASTNALELGVDIVGLDAVLIAGFPGTRASFWQQAGRAGRAGRAALVVLVARDDPLDTYLVHHPEALLGRPVEGCVLDPTNPYVLGPQLACAAAESPLTVEEVADSSALFGGERTMAVLEQLVADRVLRRRPGGWFWARHGEWPAASVDIRGGGGGQVVVVEAETGRMLGTVDFGRAPATVHEGAVYLHRGASYVVDELNLADGLALVHAETPEWSTWARTVVDVEIVDEDEVPPLSNTGVDLRLGEVVVTSQVVSYLRRRPSGEIIETVPLDLPEQSLPTRAVWYTISEELLADAGLDAARVPGALHAAEHAAIGLLPLFAVCDRWDIGGMSTALHPDTGTPTVFVHDGHPGGAGFADRGYADFVPWLTATREAIASCGCLNGCPSCVQSPKCGNGNNPLDKDGAITVLDIVLGALAGADRSPGVGSNGS
ncbi:MAG TPA: DEAD/DEAH box helicase [Pseudonocardia sp.]|jgi:DEAD/DEAH box helicase domain-containing protein|nr:DEAD/DEAH box helicase [Pseudonocardia sp.]